MLAPIIGNIKFEFCNRYTNKLTNKRARRGHCTTQTVFIH